MAEEFHRRGHHVQKAHGRRTEMAADGSHLSGGMIALMPTAEDAKRLALKGGEKAADLHLTLMFLGDDGSAWTTEEREELESLVRALAGLYELGPVEGSVFGVAHWNGGGDAASWVWNVGCGKEEDNGLSRAHAAVIEALESAHDRPELPPQHSPWAAHICAAYTDDLTLAREMEKRLGPVTFDRIRLSFGDDDRDIPLSTAVTASGALRREPLDHEQHCDFADHNRQWEGAVSTTTSRLYTEMSDWRAQIKQQIIAGMDTPEELAHMSVETTDASDILEQAMNDLAHRAGTALQREAERQGVQVPEWSLPDDTVTAAVGGRRLLRSVAQLTSDLMATSVVQTAKRVVTGMVTRSATPDQIAAEVDRTLVEGQEATVRGPVGTAMSTAQTAGRQAVLEAAPPGEYYASEILDRNTCTPCKAVDGEQFGSLEIAIKAYPVMGYKDCVGPRYGNSCRGLVVARWQPEEAQTASAATMRADEMISPEAPAEEGKNPVTTEALGKGKPSEGTDKDKRLKENQYGDGNEHDCPPGMVPDQQTGKCVEESGTEMAADTALEDAAADTTSKTAPWRGPLTVEGIETGDGREFDAGSLTWPDEIKPGEVPLRWNIEDSHGGEARTVAVNVGRIDRIWREDTGLIMGEGVFNLGRDQGREAYGMVKDGFLRGVSVDVDSIKEADMELVWPDPDPDGEGDPDPFAQLFASPEKVVFHKGRIRAATLVDIPAFSEAYIALLDEAGAVIAGGQPIGAARASFGVRTHTTSVETPARPPADWFTNPDLSVPTGITVSADGRVYGHAALWGTCHIGQAGVCVTPPQETDHPYFMTGNVWTEDGVSVSVGQITVGTGHAPLGYGHRAASDHYDNTGAAVADVAVGNDAHGIWVAGSVRPGTSAERIHELRASGQVSGDWRSIGGHLRLVGLLAVNVPGFPVPKLRTHLANGSQLALVAAGMPQLSDYLTEDDLDQWAYSRIMQKLAQRVHPGR